MVRRLVTGLIRRRLPAPPERWRIGPLRAGRFDSPLRSERLTSQLGIAAGAALLVCFTTGMVSHLVQHPAWWTAWPSRPVNLYRITQGLHVATGLAAVPLLGAKLWSVYPRLFAWPPMADLAHAGRRAAVTVLVATSLFQLVTGVLNVARWYAPMPFFFTVAHHWTAWLLLGALCWHLAGTLPVVRRALRRAPGTALDAGRRSVLAAAGAAAAVLTLATVGQTVRPLAGLDVLGQRRPDRGPQGLPVNKSAVQAAVGTAARSPTYRLHLVGPRSRVLTRAQLCSMPQHTVDLPIACVEGWSAGARWGGVRVVDLLALVGAHDGARLRVESLQHGGLYRAATLPAAHCRDPLSLLALRIDGDELSLDHGYPCRIIAPNLPGVLQTKWVSRLEVLP